MKSRLSRVLAQFASLGIQDLLLAQIYPMLSSVLITFITARALGPSGRGDLAFVTATCTLAGAVCFLSLHVGAAELQVRGLPGMRAALRIICGVDGVLVLATATGVVTGVMNSRTAILVLGTALVALNLVVLRSVQAVGGNSDYRTSWAIQSLGYAITGIPVAVLSHDWRWVIACWALMIAASTIYSYRTFRHVAIRTPPESSHLRRTLAASLMAHVGSIGMQILYRADLVVLGLVGTSAAVGIYSIAVTASGFVWNIAEAFSLRAFQRSTTSHNEQDARIRDSRLVRANLVISILIGGLICLVSALAIPFLLPGYRASVPLIFILSIGVVAQAPARVALAALQRREAYRFVVGIGLAAIATSVFYVPLAYYWGSNGLAWGSTAAYCALAAATLGVWRYTSPRS